MFLVITPLLKAFFGGSFFGEEQPLYRRKSGNRATTTQAITLEYLVITIILSIIVNKVFATEYLAKVPQKVP